MTGGSPAQPTTADTAREGTFRDAALPLLRPEEEPELAFWIEAGVLAQERLTGDGVPPAERAALCRLQVIGSQALDRFSRANIRLLYYWAHRDWRHRDTAGLDVEDLVAAGFSGLITAIHRWDFQRGLKFSTYGSWWIRQAMQREVRRNRRVGLSHEDAAALEQLFRARFDLERSLGRPPRTKELAEALAISQAAVRDLLLMSDRGHHVVSLDAPTRDDGSGALVDLTDHHAPAADQEPRLAEALAHLPARQRAIVAARVGWGCPERTEEDLAVAYGVSVAQVRRVCLEGLSALRTILEQEQGEAA